jgi:hypothetical protein
MPLFSLSQKSLYALQTAGLDIGVKVSVAYVYVMNIIALVMLFLLPALVWYNYFKHKEKPIMDVARFRITTKHWVNCMIFALFNSSIFIFASKTVFRIEALLGGESLAGVDILTQQISLNSLEMLIAISLGIAFASFLIAYFWEKAMNYVMLPLSYAFFGYYIFLFAKSVSM